MLVSLSDKAEATLRRLENPRANNFTRTGARHSGAPAPAVPVSGAPVSGAPIRVPAAHSAPVTRAASRNSGGQPLFSAPVAGTPLGDTSVSSAERIQLRATEQAWREQREAAGLANPGAAW